MTSSGITGITFALSIALIYVPGAADAGLGITVYVFVVTILFNLFVGFYDGWVWLCVCIQPSIGSYPHYSPLHILYLVVISQPKYVSLIPACSLSQVPQRPASRTKWASATVGSRCLGSSARWLVLSSTVMYSYSAMEVCRLLDWLERVASRLC